MAAKSSMMIQFPRGGIIPADVLKSEKDRDCGPGEPVKVPKAYADHLIERRIAVAAEETTKANTKATTPKGKETANPKTKDATAKTANDDPHAALKENVAKGEKAVANARTDATKAKAQEFLDAAKQALADASAGS